MNYIVAGVQRSGTSMMMRCLEKGGMEAVYDEAHSQKLADTYRTDDYDPNPHGYYENWIPVVNSPGWMHRQRGKLVKIFIPDAVVLPADGSQFRIVVMLRNPEEIEASWERTFHGDREKINFAATQERAVGIMQQRRDMEIVTCDYNRIVEDVDYRWEFFWKLRAEGWPLTNPPAAAEAVDPNLYRNRDGLINNSDAVLQRLSHWPIDVRMAATAVDPSLWRHRSATQEGTLSQSDWREHPARDEIREAAKTGYSDRDVESWKEPQTVSPGKWVI